MSYKEKIGVIIPSLSPDERLVTLVKELKEQGFLHILVVNDGSSADYDEFFNRTKEMGATVLRHVVNQGKGRALKTAFNFILEHWQDCTGAITIDSDGQHAVKDIIRCCEALMENPDCLIMGCRNFKQDNVPFKSSFGNILTSKVMKLLVGIAVSDTQTGLRAMSAPLMGKFLKVTGERFEYETNMLLCCKEETIAIKEVSIETIYYENNKSTHFRPFQDSVKIYGLFLKFIAASLSSSVIDLGIFTVGTLLLKDMFPGYYIIISTVIARVISSLYNFFVNRQTVFKSDDNLTATMIKYYILAVVQMALSAAGVMIVFTLFGGNETLIKVIVDCLLFVISFQIQREWVFKKKGR
ncbi:MAG: bifunctional glycosyltransferase family 2/GtrA family protein [Lachnospiraceae bacterium]|nr:bifunctional glycosyltransferase family 2/GtrA family protein [Lachnospiraceae bacterium]